MITAGDEGRKTPEPQSIGSFGNDSRQSPPEDEYGEDNPLPVITITPR